MATIYRFIVETQTKATKSGRKSAAESGAVKKSTGKGKWITALNSDKGGVEHNRKMRAINPLLNRLTGGNYEKATRLGRAGLGLIRFNTATGAIGLSPVAIAIIISFIIQTVMKIQKRDINLANMRNDRNYKSLENGFGAVRGQFDITVNYWNGRRTYNENK